MKRNLFLGVAIAVLLGLFIAAGPGPGSDPNSTTPAAGAVAVTPSDTDNIFGSGDSRFSRAIYVGVSGDIKMTMSDDSVVTRKAVPVGEWPWCVKRIWATGTTATDMVADY